MHTSDLHGPQSRLRPSKAPLLRRITWSLVIALAVLALVRPLFSIVGWSDALGKPLTPILLTIAITVVWIGVVGLSRVREPVWTLLATGLAYAVLAIILSAILSPVLTGRLQGPIANPVAIIPTLITNAVWGTIAGLLSWLLQRLRGVRHDA